MFIIEFPTVFLVPQLLHLQNILVRFVFTMEYYLRNDIVVLDHIQFFGYVLKNVTLEVEEQCSKLLGILVGVLV
jgi:hypothetical protein